MWAAAAGGAIIGDNIGYAIGYHGGYRLVRRYGKKLPMDETKLKVGRMLFDRHGGKMVFFGRLVSILRTYAAFLAGVNGWPGTGSSCSMQPVRLCGPASTPVGFYYAASTLRRFRGSVDIALGVVAAVAIVVFGV